MTSSVIGKNLVQYYQSFSINSILQDYIITYRKLFLKK